MQRNCLTSGNNRRVQKTSWLVRCTIPILPKSSPKNVITAFEAVAATGIEANLLTAM